MFLVGFFHLSKSIYRQIQDKELTTENLEDQDIAIQMKMLSSHAFVPEHDVIDSFTILMGDFPESAIEIFSYYVYIIIALSLKYPDLVIKIYFIDEMSGYEMSMV